MNFWYHINKRILPQLVWRKPPTHKSVYLTFDDGPHPQITPWVMNQLDKYGAKGTFFVVGDNAERYPELIEEITERGHSIGNHTQHHVKGWGMTDAAYIEEIKLCDKRIPENRLFRPPFGRINIKSIKQLADYEIIMWDVLSRDYLKRLDTHAAQRRIRNRTVDGSIAVFHDSEKAEKNLKMLLPNYLSFLNEQGYKMEKL
ncbi:MAG: polysaccharide deacetylase family protein [Bacteroidia bacterium]|nr:polysaccharide deacetylase family protein [Bacteroidia bacterium]NNJ54904.1 polysaccharide deacetylase family protein [Bacteroidia bacterium]